MSETPPALGVPFVKYVSFFDYRTILLALCFIRPAADLSIGECLPSRTKPKDSCCAHLFDSGYSYPSPFWPSSA